MRFIYKIVDRVTTRLTDAERLRKELEKLKWQYSISEDIIQKHNDTIQHLDNAFRTVSEENRKLKKKLEELDAVDIRIRDILDQE